MNILRFVTAITLCLLSSGILFSTATATTEQQYTAISRLGQLNGIALHCKYLHHMQQIKQALVANLPKQRALGELFDKTTNQAYIDFVTQRKSCPDKSAFSQKVNAAIDTLQDNFSHPY